MFSKQDKGLVLLIFFIGNFSSASAQQVPMQKNDEKDIPAQLTAQTKFSALPAKCITLTQGRQCFATVTFTWKTAIKGNYCLYQEGNKEALDCWFNQKQNTAIFEFESSETLHYQLVAYDYDKIISTTAIEVSWVHKASPRKRRWRLF
ncbi:DUF3019 domain-containing protein [Cognaticolwellia mytili]|uniref:DUF3019 domain-containing protein n=1 Tax=Cognaticolwellia mytili TaxID=1888913 RepID=UPI000A16DCA1|nr:DUF3019 domain-containing protein [Cognaticolwellia mytili]